jgi:hypothetical protein
LLLWVRYNFEIGRSIRLKDDRIPTNSRFAASDLCLQRIVWTIEARLQKRFMNDDGEGLATRWAKRCVVRGDAAASEAADPGP